MVVRGWEGGGEGETCGKEREREKENVFLSVGDYEQEKI